MHLHFPQPFAHTLNILKNKLNGAFETFTPAEFAQGLAKDYRIVDASLKPSIEGAPLCGPNDRHWPDGGLWAGGKKSS